MAREQPGQTLQPTALVHEAWLRLRGGEAAGAHFFAAEAMWRILIDRARRRLAARKAELVNLHYFASLPIAEAAEVLGISPATAHRDWTYARAWLHQDIGAARPLR